MEIVQQNRQAEVAVRRPAALRISLWQKIKRGKVSYLLISPYMILFFIFTVIPVVASLLLSFTYFNMLEFPKWRGLMNYERLFLDDDIFLIAVKNTLIFAFLTGPLSYFLCFVFAWFVKSAATEN